MEEFHSLLRRQIKKHLDGRDLSGAECRVFLEAVDAAYRQADQDRNTLERSLDLSSQELLAANASLQNMKEVLEKRVAERTRELESANERLRKELDERRKLEEQLLLSRKLEAVGRLAGGVAHDFNNLLTAIMGYGDLADTLINESEDPELSSYILEVQKAAQRAAALTQQLLAFSRKQNLKPVVLDLNVLVTDLDRMLQRMIGEDIELATIPSPQLWSVRADPGQIEQAVMNLVVNARDAMPRGGQVLVRTRNLEIKETLRHGIWEIPAGDYVTLSVSDTGEGMTEEVKARIFEPFFTTKEKGKGTGLGLATVYGVVKQSGAFITVDSRLGKGSVFTIYFPSAMNARPEPRAADPPSGVRRGSGEMVLLAEDEKSVRTLAGHILQANGYETLAARSGDEALRLSEGHAGPVHLLLVDMVMPGMGGHELIERLRERRPEVKVLLMSGYAENIAAQQNGNGVKAAFLPKPFLPQDLLQAVRRALDS